MRIAGSIILGVIGAVLYFAVTAEVSGIDLPTVGVIMMAAAAVWFIVELVGGFSRDGSGAASTSGTPTQDTTRDTRATGAKDVESS